MKALTLIRPWPYAICHLGKRVENRSWPPPKSLIGQRIAIHAGKKFDAYDAQAIHENHQVPVPTAEEHPTGIVATAILKAVVTDKDKPWYEHRRWYFGPYGWVLEDVQVLPEAIPCRGAQGLWDIPGEVARLLGAAA